MIVMKSAYRIVLMLVSVVVLSWFLPWLYSLFLPEVVSDPFVAYSPVSDTFIVSERDADGEVHIFDIDSAGVSTGAAYTKEQRDSLLPQIYFSQLISRRQLPDSLDGVELTMQAFRRNQWVFTSSPRDINKRKPDVYLIMESMPARFELEDPKEVFRLDGKVEFVDMATNSVNESRSKKFSRMFSDKGFAYPAKDLSANITARKAYDEGYLLVDADGKVFHMKMQAGRPYMTAVSLPDSVVAEHVFIMENIDNSHLGFVTDKRHNLYVIERDGYRLVHLPVGKFDPSTDRLTVMKNLFNWVVKVNNRESSRWVALDVDGYGLLAEYEVRGVKSTVQTVAEYIFPFELSFTSNSDCYAYPRIGFISGKAIYLNVVLAVAVIVVFRKRTKKYRFIAGFMTLVFGIFLFIPAMLIKD